MRPFPAEQPGRHLRLVDQAAEPTTGGLVTVVVPFAPMVQPDDGWDNVTVNASSPSLTLSFTSVIVIVAADCPCLNLTIPDRDLKSDLFSAVPSAVAKRTLAASTGDSRVTVRVTRRAPSLTVCVAAAKLKAGGGAERAFSMKVLMLLSATFE